MADGNQLPSTSAQKRARRDDSLELNNTMIAKRPRNDDDPKKTAMIQCFHRFIGDEGMAVFSVETFVRLGHPYPPHPPIIIEAFDQAKVIKVDPTSTVILYGLLRGLVPGFTISTEEGIQILMTMEQFKFVRNVLIGIYFDRRRQMDAVIQRARAPPLPFLQASNLSDTSNGSLQLDPQLQQVSGRSGMYPQQVDNDAPHVYDFNTAVQPHTHPIQFENTDVNPVPGPSQPVLPQASQMIQRSVPQKHGPPLQVFYKLLTPEDRTLQEQLQAQVRREQVRAQEMAPASGHNTQLPQQDNDPKQNPALPSQSSAANLQTPYQPKRKNAVERIVTGDLLRRKCGPRSRNKPAVVTQPQRTQSESAVPHNQTIGQQQHIQNISQLSQLTSTQLDSSPNGVPTGATSTDAIDVDRFFAIHSIQRSSTVAGYPAIHSTGLGLDIPSRSHSASISPNTPIAGPSATLPSTRNSPPSGTGHVNQADRAWISHYPQASQQQTNIQNQAVARPAREFTFLAPHGEDYSPAKNKRSGSKSREQRLSVSPGNGRQRAPGGLTSRPASVPLPDRGQERQEEEEEEEEGTQAIDGADVRPAQLPSTVVYPTTWVLVEPRQPVGGSFGTSAQTQGGFAQYANQTASFMAPPQQQQQLEAQVQGPISSATTPITPLPATTIVPPIVAQTQQQPQVASDDSAAPSVPAVPAASSSPAVPGPVIASDSGFDFSFFFGRDPPPGELATGGTTGSSNDASQPQVESTQFPVSSEFEELFGITDLNFSFDTAALDVNSQSWVE